MSNDVGYGKPPKKHQFKPGQSGCPDGGAAIKREKKKDKDKDASLQQQVTDWLMRKRRVTINGKRQWLSLIELVQLRLEEDALVRRDPAALKRILDIAREHGCFEPPKPKTGKTGVLAVRPIRTQEEWIKATEGELLPRDPLHGIPGAEGLLDQPPAPRKSTLEEK